MSPALRLAPLFLGILAALPACPFGCDDATIESTQTFEVAPAALEAALADGSLGLDECSMLCQLDSTTGEPMTTTGEQPTTSDAGGTAGGSTGDASTSGSSTGEASTGDASTGDASTSGTSTGDAGTTDAGTTGGYINPDLTSCEVVEGMANMVSCNFSQACIGGRRPAGLRSSASCEGDEVGAWFAATAHLEAASVPAFERLLAELQAHGAPEALLRAAVDAARDEVRHAAAMTAMARRHGAEVVAVELAPAQSRSLLALALENAVEGCVQETWAALLAAHQAEAAGDPEVRALMAEIAADEARHAELAWAVDAWLNTRLTPEERQLVADARAAAGARLRPRADLPDAWIRGLGLPTRARAEPMWRALDAALWAA